MSRARVSSSEERGRLERLARMTALAEQVWEDRALAHQFLNAAQPQLGGERPIILAQTEEGARQVERLLLKLEYSLPV
jgi:putative toxin-antitoxin system antitoxin component (TIGR02293 family)